MPPTQLTALTVGERLRYDRAFHYLTGVGPRSNLAKIRASLDDVELGCNSEAAEQVLRSRDACDELDNALLDDDPEIRQEAREALCSEIDYLVDLIEDADEEVSS